MVFRRVIDVLSWIALAVLMIFAAALILSVFNLGVRAFVVSSGSMSPSINTGDLVFVHGSGSYNEGDVITYVNSRNKYVTHRVFDIKYKEGIPTYTTKGDANKNPDGNRVMVENVMGRVVFNVPFMGYPIAFFHTKIGLAFLIIGIGALVIWIILSSEDSPRKRLRKAAW